MKLPTSIAEKLALLQDGEKIPFSKMKHIIIESMLENGILHKQIQGRRKTLIYLQNTDKLKDYLGNHFGISNLKNYVEISKRNDLSRADAIAISSDSKLRSIRTFKGFLVNSYDRVECIIKGEKMILYPKEGTFTFIYDFEDLQLSPEITIVGIENPESFRYIREQKYLFSDIHPLFVSRYPQNRDLIKWLQIIPNNYLHFGDFDYAGLNIYMNEYKKHLNNRARYFLPPNVEIILSKNGNRNNYDNQTILFDKKNIIEKDILLLLEIIEKYKKGLEQEIFIMK
ncbi:hypothetical protein [Dysgonomonas macrotermitis]|uniref:DUF7281 domain-containing protein n=1 Tax=Dysgonomonas macrotermitis TaxID=1346286 RepID=A0A1M5IL35_9BACT|nr:hypothetical protein [Dysgonomonas macrotermitis]SHG28630.1 hypothetical protein SAMN05444362_12017 [Dysgonomonas macrotermitis]